ncbi:sensor histidine kinase [Mesobacillus subterraneus]|nr:HAMP domain-containing sensor histidine kinase [Mesobacillus subterraneus]
MKLKTKIHVFTTLLAVVIFAVMNGITYFLFEQMSYSGAAAPLRADAQQAVAKLSTTDSLPEIKTILRAYVPANGAIQLIHPDGKMLASVETTEGLHNIHVEISPDENYTLTQQNGQRIMTIHSTALLSDGSVAALHIHQELKEIGVTLNLLKKIVLIATLTGAGLMFLSSFILGRQVTAPIHRLIQQMRENRIAGAYERIKLNEHEKDETAQMGREFNEMMKELEEHFGKQEQFVSNASHELKTPLTIIESYANLLKRRGVENKELTDEALTSILSETERMKDMIRQFLELARSRQPIEVPLKPTDIVPVIKNTGQQLGKVYAREVVVSAPESFTIETDEARLRELLVLLVDNALKYSEKAVRVDLQPDRISIHDEGIGIPDEAIPRLFDRFYRVASDRNRKTGGTGLGLSLAKELASQLDLDISVKSKVGEGTSIFLTFKQ